MKTIPLLYFKGSIGYINDVIDRFSLRFQMSIAQFPFNYVPYLPVGLQLQYLGKFYTQTLSFVRFSLL